MINNVKLIGKLLTVNEDYILVGINRTSGVTDFVRVIPTNKGDLVFGVSVKINGMLYTTNTKENGKTKLNLFVKGLVEHNDTPYDTYNNVNFVGWLVKEPVYRETPLGRTITDLHIAINDGAKSYYIPVITFGDVAKKCATYKVGDKLNITGRFQSRDYIKRIELDAIPKRAYEIAASTIFKED